MELCFRLHLPAEFRLYIISEGNRFALCSQVLCAHLRNEANYFFY